MASELPGQTPDGDVALSNEQLGFLDFVRTSYRAEAHAQMEAIFRERAARGDGSVTDDDLGTAMRLQDPEMWDSMQDYYHHMLIGEEPHDPE